MRPHVDSKLNPYHRTNYRPSRVMFLLGLAVALPIAHAFQSIPSSRGTQGESVSRLYYNYFKKDGEKKEIGRLWKNIIFPGIYQGNRLSKYLNKISSVLTFV